MTRKELIRKADEVDSDGFVERILDVYPLTKNAELAAVLFAWISNGFNREYFVMTDCINNIIRGGICDFICGYDAHRTFAPNGIETFYGTLTYAQLDALCLSLSRIIKEWGSLCEAYQASYKEHKCKMPHEAFFYAIGGGCGFPKRSANCTFYRYNLLFYWLTYKMHIWEDVDISTALLPCNDKVLQSAYELGVVRNRMKANLSNVITLSDKARDWFGEDDFFKMYQLLNFYE